jgi:Fe-S cluster biosynthesis and repair protein YggX
VYQLLGGSLIKLDRRDDAATVLEQGFRVADERGDNIPRDEMVKLLTQLGRPAPVSTKTARPTDGPGEGFRCQRPGCFAGNHARRLAKPPMNDELGQRVYDRICADCWDYWLRNLSIKVINEMHLDLSTERGQEVYDQIMRETLGLD